MTGTCVSATADTCRCYTGYQGDVCQNVTVTTETPLQSSSTTNWTVIVAVVSAVAGLLLIIALAMIIFYLVKKCRHSPAG